MHLIKTYAVFQTQCRLWLVSMFFPRCMECQRGPATSKISVRLYDRIRKTCPDFYTILKII